MTQTTSSLSHPQLGNLLSCFKPEPRSRPFYSGSNCALRLSAFSAIVEAVNAFVNEKPFSEN